MIRKVKVLRIMQDLQYPPNRARVAVHPGLRVRGSSFPTYDAVACHPWNNESSPRLTV